jgi:hypothetical protein
VHARIGRKLVESIRHDTVVRDDRAREVFTVEPRGVADAIARALAYEDGQFARTRWSDSLASADVRRQWGGARFGSRLVDSRSAVVPLTAEQAFAPIRCIGGTRGWYFGDWLWLCRGILDKLIGGPGMRRGRRNPQTLTPGDALDFWRVEAVEPDRLLRLSAEMKVPGRAWLQFEVEPKDGGARIRQTALFDPLGLWGLVYWYMLFPVHAVVFRGMLRGIVAAAREQAAQESATASVGSTDAS